MENSKEALQRAVALIKNSGVKKGMDVTEEEMARKLDISEKQLYVYLNGEDTTPADLPVRLKSAYGIRRYVVESTQVHRVREPRPAEDESTRSENNSKSLKATISFIKKIGKNNGMNITDEELALKAGISTKQLNAYSNGEEKIPDDLSSLLRSAYADLINSVRMENNRETLKHTVVLIRNRGLGMGVNITVEEMAQKIDIPEEALYAYLNDENDIPQDDLPHRLRSIYNDLLKNLKGVEIIEDINMVKSRNVSGK
ncbi:MAG TPA: hypothetical protein VK563_15205 [Puia sp.]|nr:hypothetical protein [Puia sp.]